MSSFSDNIVIILESESTFSELGAFSNHKLRNKIIVINDIKFKDSKSFINLGPIKAIEEAKGKEVILYYKMRDDGVIRVDSIGEIFEQLHSLLDKATRKRIVPIKLSEIDPSENFNKQSVMIVHDLVYFIGPMTHQEIVEILLTIFGKKRFQLTEHMALLTAIESVERTKEGLYRSRRGKPYYRYQFDTYRLMALSRNYMAKFHGDRLYGN